MHSHMNFKYKDKGIYPYPRQEGVREIEV